MSLVLSGSVARGDVSTFPFFGMREYFVGADPRGVATGDFDRDGWPDLVVSNQGEKAVRILDNRGDGSFALGRSYDVGNYPLRVLPADVNRDHVLDLLVENDFDNDASLLLGNPDGSFQPEIRLSADRIDVSPALVDVDGNDTLDLLTFRLVGSTYELSLQRGNGDGSFTAPERTAISGAGTVQGFAVGDFDGSNGPDVAYSRNQSWFIYLNDGSGSFSLSSGAQAAATGTTGAIEAADLDGDTDLDLVLALPGQKQIEILVGQGDGSFAPDDARLDYSIPSAFGLDGNPTELGTQDLDGDGLPEIFLGLTRSGGGSSTTRLLWHHNVSLPGDPAFQTASQTVLVDNVHGLAFADVDRDGVPNAIVGGGRTNPPFGGYDAVAVLAFTDNFGKPELETRRSLLIGDILNLDVGDIVGTPDPEIVFAANGSTGTYAGYLENLGSGVFAQDPNFVFVTNEVADAAIADFDPDNVVYPDARDLATGGAGELGARPSDGLGSFLVVFPVMTGYFTNVTELEAADIDLDGDADLAYADRSEGVGYWLSDEDGNFPFSPLLLTGNATTDLELADMDLDGDLDFLSTRDDSTPELIVKPNGFAQNGGAPDDIEDLPFGAKPTALAVGDFDGDSYPDVAVADANTVYLFRNQQDGTVTPDGEISVGIGQPRDIAAGDVNGDGLDDLAVLDSTDGRASVAIYPASGGGSFEAPYHIATGTPGYVSTPSSVLLTDLDGDGRADLVVGNSSFAALGKGLRIYHNRGSFVPVPEPSASVAGLTSLVALFAITRARRGTRSLRKVPPSDPCGNQDPGGSGRHRCAHAPPAVRQRRTRRPCGWVAGRHRASA